MLFVLDSLVVITLAILVIATYTDIKTLEVPDWLNYAGIVAELGIRAAVSGLTWDYKPILSGGIGFGIGFGLACALYYSRQWGGGDSKLLMALGALMGVEFTKQSQALAFLTNLVIVGALYGLVYSTILALKHRKIFAYTFKKFYKTRAVKRLRLASTILAVAFFALSFLVQPILGVVALAIAGLLIALTYLAIFVKSVEQSCMRKLVTPDKLTEGDWVVKDIIVDGKRIAGPRDLGLEKDQIKKLTQLYQEKKIGKVKIKLGMPFVPVFLASYATMLVFGNIFLSLASIV